MLEILNFVEPICMSELDSASMQGRLHREASAPFSPNVAHLLAKAWLCFPDLLQPPLFGFPFGQLATGLLFDLGFPG